MVGWIVSFAISGLLVVLMLFVFREMMFIAEFDADCCLNRFVFGFYLLVWVDVW